MTGTKLTPKGKPMDWWANPRERARGRSTLAKWSCGCQNVRVGTREFQACCLKCGNVFQRADALPEGRTQSVPATSRSIWEQGHLVWPESDGSPDPGVSDQRPTHPDAAGGGVSVPLL